MFEVEKYGHATRKIVPQSLQDQLEEIIAVGLRTVEGVTTEVGIMIFEQEQSIIAESERAGFVNHYLLLSTIKTFKQN